VDRVQEEEQSNPDTETSAEMMEAEFQVSALFKDDQDLAELRNEVLLAAQAVDFVNKASAAVPSVEMLIRSKTASDVNESIQFFARAINFSVPASAKTFQR
jgi:hypothetical protein